MPTPSTGPIGFNDLNTELGSPATTLRTLNDAAVRGLAGAPFSTPGTTISLNDLRGKSSFSVTGGTIIPSATTGNGYIYHVFLSPSPFVISTSSPKTLEYLVVAGGGGGGGGRWGAGGGGGGGAGGLRTGSIVFSTPDSFTVTVGSGGLTGPAVPQPVAPFYPGRAGNPSSFGPYVTSTGGGAAGGYNQAGTPGGSGGGGADGGGAGSGNTPPTTPPQGNPGGPTSSGGGARGGAGGGGAGAAGNSGTPTNAGPGGAGLAVPAYAYPIIAPAIPAPLQPTFGPAVGPTGLYAGGGGGGSDSAGGPAGSGGPGGGGAGSSTGVATPARTNTGGGGGGGATGGPGSLGFAGGDGGSGIVIIRYLA